jgi:hypothetical protein
MTDPVLREILVDRSESFSLTRVEWGRQSTLGGLAAERSGDNMTEQTRQASSRESAEAQALSWRGFTLSLPRLKGMRRPSRRNSRLNLAFLNSPGSANTGLDFQSSAERLSRSRSGSYAIPLLEMTG